MPARDVQCKVDVTSESYVSGFCSALRYAILWTSFCDFLRQNSVTSFK